MKRRDFLKTMAAGTTIACSSNIFANTAKSKVFQINMEYSADFKSTKDIKLYVPLPTPTAFQKISDFKIQGNFASHQIAMFEGYPFVFAEFNSDQLPQKILKTSFKVEVFPNQVYALKKNEDSKQFIKQTRYIRTDGKIEEISNKASSMSKQDKISYFRKFIAKNLDQQEIAFSEKIKTIRDKDQNTILSGENISGNSILVALCRASKIPAREIFGFIIQDNKLIATNKAEVLINQQWHLIDTTAKNHQDFIAFNHLRDIYINQIYAPSAHRIIGSIDSNNLKYYQDLSQNLKVYAIA